MDLYHLTEYEMNFWKNAFEKLLEPKDAEFELTGLPLNPAKVVSILEELGWYQYNSDDAGWEGDRWYYFSRGNDKICFYYCGFDFQMTINKNE